MVSIEYWQFEDTFYNVPKYTNTSSLDCDYNQSDFQYYMGSMIFASL